MILAEVVGNLWATKKSEALNEYKLLVLRQLYEDNSSEYKPMVAADTLDAGIGDMVITGGGSAARRGAGGYLFLRRPRCALSHQLHLRLYRFAQRRDAQRPLAE